MGRRRSQLRRLRGRDRLPEHGARLRARGRRDPRAGGALPPPVLHGRRVRAVRGGLQAARRALAVRLRRAALDPRQHRRGGDRERREDRAGSDRPPGGDRVRERLPRADAADDDDDGEARLQEGLRPLRPRGLPRARPVPLPRGLERRRAGGAGGPLPLRRRSAVGRVRGARDRPGRGRLHPHARGLPGPLAGAALLTRHPLRRRRGAVGHGPHGTGLGDRALRRRAGHRRLREVAGRRPAARRRHRPGGGHGRRAPGRTGRDVRRQPAVLRGGARRARRGGDSRVSRAGGRDR